MEQVEQLKIKAELYAERYPLSRRLDSHRSILRGRLPLTNANILDIGCGHSHEILDLIQFNNSYKFTGIDEDETSLNLLSEDLLKMGPGISSKVNLIKQKWPFKDINYENFDAIIFHNLLHFFSINKLFQIFSNLHHKIKPNTLISVVVHSTRHSANRENNHNRYQYFKHYFAIGDLKKLFPSSFYSLEVQGILEVKQTEEEIQLLRDWCKTVYEKDGITQQNIINHLTEEYLRSTEENKNFIHYVVRRK